jgi:hypothetical protein
LVIGECNEKYRKLSGKSHAGGGLNRGSHEFLDDKSDCNVTFSGVILTLIIMLITQKGELWFKENHSELVETYRKNFYFEKKRVLFNNTQSDERLFYYIGINQNQ